MLVEIHSCNTNLFTKCDREEKPMNINYIGTWCGTHNKQLFIPNFLQYVRPENYHKLEKPM